MEAHLIENPRLSYLQSLLESCHSSSPHASLPTAASFVPRVYSASASRGRTVFHVLIRRVLRARTTTAFCTWSMWHCPQAGGGPGRALPRMLLLLASLLILQVPNAVAQNVSAFHCSVVARANHVLAGLLPSGRCGAFEAAGPPTSLPAHLPHFSHCRLAPVSWAALSLPPAATHTWLA